MGSRVTLSTGRNCIEKLGSDELAFVPAELKADAAVVAVPVVGLSQAWGTNVLLELLPNVGV